MSNPAYALVDSTGKVVSLVDITPTPAGVPGQSTFVPPAGQTMVPTNGALVPPGSTYAKGVFTGPAVAPSTLAQNEKAVDIQRDALLATGFADAKTGKTWQCDPTSRGFLTAVGSSAASALTLSPQPTFQLIAADNTSVTLDATDTYALINGRIFPWVSNMVMYARTLKNLYIAGTPPGSITTGWPTS